MNKYGANNSMRLIYLMDILKRKTNDEHGLSTKEIIAELKEYGIIVERKTIYKDIESLQNYGLDIVSVNNGRSVKYYLGNRIFELPELKLIVDAIQACRFITNKKSKKLIGKIESLTNEYDEGELNRQIYVTDKIKSENESIYYNVDSLYSAINLNKKVIFKYFQWYGKEKRLKRNGELYSVSPWIMLWNDQNYYLVGFDDRSKEIRHYRVDKMLSISIKDEDRDGRVYFENFDMDSFSAGTFGMFSGHKDIVSLICKKEISGVIFDRFGREIKVKEIGEDQLEIFVEVNLSVHFLGWILSLGNDVKISGPEYVIKMMLDMLNERLKIYQKK